MDGILLIGALIAAGYFISKKENPLKQSNPLILPIPEDKSIFPLKLGDNNIFVKNLQGAILNKGGEAASLVLKAGGANGHFSAMLETALKFLGLPVQIDEATYRTLINNSAIVRNYAYVSEPQGATCYASVGDTYLPGYGYGRDKVISLPNKTYLGVGTGNYKNGMLELTTTINTKKIKFWVSTQHITLISKEEYESLKNSKIIEKSVESKNKLLTI